MTWIQTYTGRAFDLLNPKPADVCLDDVAHALARLGRFTGHAKGFYSVAQHCWHVSQMVPPECALWGLLHDAAEAYVGDVSAPLKWAMRHLGGKAHPFYTIEKRVEAAVLDHFGLVGEEPAAVKEADLRMLMTEARELLGPTPRPWSIPYEPYDMGLIALPPDDAERFFRARFAELTGASRAA